MRRAAGSKDEPGRGEDDAAGAISLDRLSPPQARAFMVADNRLTDTSTWDDQLLAETLRDLSVLDLDFSLEATGFDMGEIDFRIEGLDLNDAAAHDKADDVPDVVPGPAISRPGALWLLDRHRVLCASALEDDSYATLRQGEHASTVFTDPPYNVPIPGVDGGLNPRINGDGLKTGTELAIGPLVARLLADRSLSMPKPPLGGGRRPEFTGLPASHNLPRGRSLVIKTRRMVTDKMLRQKGVGVGYPDPPRTLTAETAPCPLDPWKHASVSSP